MKLKVIKGEETKSYNVEFEKHNYYVIWRKNCYNEADGYAVYNDEGDELNEKKDDVICEAIIKAIEKSEAKK